MLLLLIALPALADDPPMEIVVVEESTSNAPDPSTTPASVTVLQVDQNVAASDDLAGVVGSAAGVTVQRLGGLGEWSGVSIRGSTFRQVEVHLDGIPLNPDGTDSVDLGALPLRAFEHIEVYRGAAPPELDATALGGVINLVTGETDEQTEASITAGSYGTAQVYGTSSVQGELGVHPWDALVVADAFRSQGDFVYFDDNATPYNLFDDQLRERQNNDRQRFTTHGRWRIGTPDRRLTLLDAFQVSDGGLPGTANASAEHTRLGVSRNLLAMQLERSGGTLMSRVRTWHQHRAVTWDNRSGEMDTGNEWSRYDNSIMGLVAHGAWAPSPFILPSLTTSARHDIFRETSLLDQTR
ncbi:MAG: TonB-dependent receptor plug domain-containing protein, partial [Myxococcota bacterium]|nr:TonB-dependent receptor plug domain-containing protein [Myxococcota bacterium]